MSETPQPPPAPEPLQEPPPPPDDTAIEIRGLVKRYGNLKAVDDITFSIPKGCIAGFVGPNGCGKTTTMRILATLLKQDRGVARVFGRDTRKPSTQAVVRHLIGFMPDYFGLYSDMTAGEYLEFFGAAYRIKGPKRRALVDDILALVNLQDKKDTMVSGLSRGMQQRLTLGRCLVHSPDLLLLDEPASGLDPRARIELMELLRELKAMGKTIFISSHILSELGNLCDMVVIMERGQLRYVGPLEDAQESIRAGDPVLELTINGADESTADRLAALPGINSVQFNSNVFFAEYDREAGSGEIIRAVVTSGIDLQEAKRSSASLEEIFMSLTEQE